MEYYGGNFHRSSTKSLNHPKSVFWRLFVQNSFLLALQIRHVLPWSQGLSQRPRIHWKILEAHEGCMGQWSVKSVKCRFFHCHWCKLEVFHCHWSNLVKKCNNKSIKSMKKITKDYKTISNGLLARAMALWMSIPSCWKMRFPIDVPAFWFHVTYIYIHIK